MSELSKEHWDIINRAIAHLEINGCHEMADELREVEESASITEPVLWRFTGIGGLKKVLTNKQYQAQTSAVRKWYEPMCAKCRHDA